MNSEAYKRVAQCVKGNASSTALGRPFFSGDTYEALDFDAENFSTIASGRRKKGRRFVFIDGGNLELVASPNFSIQHIRLAYVCLQDLNGGGSKRSRLPVPNVVDALSVATWTSGGENGGGARFAIRFFPLNGERELLPEDGVIDYVPEGFVDEDITLRPVSAAGCIGRKWAEWHSARVVARALNEGDVIVRDGVLQSAQPKEGEYALAAYEAAKDRGVVFTALAKTSTLMTTTGLPLLAAVQKLADNNGWEGEWYYHPIAKNLHPEYLGDIYVAKLYRITRYAFRFEVHNGVDMAEVEDVLSYLAEHSRNALFPGYPYGLVMVDKMARVTRNEREREARRLMGHLNDETVKRCIASVDAHRFISEY